MFKKLVLVLLLSNIVLATEFEITEMIRSDSRPLFQASDDCMVWEAGEEIWYFGLSGLVQVTSNTHDDNLNVDGRGNVSGENIVWQAYINNVYQICFYDGDSVTQITWGIYGSHEPRIIEDVITWYEYDYHLQEYIVYEATFDLQGPSMADINEDQVIDLYDFSMLADYWLVEY